MPILIIFKNGIAKETVLLKSYIAKRLEMLTHGVDSRMIKAS